MEKGKSIEAVSGLPLGKKGTKSSDMIGSPPGVGEKKTETGVQ